MGDSHLILKMSKTTLRWLDKRKNHANQRWPIFFGRSFQKTYRAFAITKRKGLDTFSVLIRCFLSWKQMTMTWWSTQENSFQMATESHVKKSSLRSTQLQISSNTTRTLVVIWKSPKTCRWASLSSNLNSQPKTKILSSKFEIPRNRGKLRRRKNMVDMIFWHTVLLNEFKKIEMEDWLWQRGRYRKFSEARMGESWQRRWWLDLLLGYSLGSPQSFQSKIRYFIT